jgi:hypothetical protein
MHTVNPPAAGHVPHVWATSEDVMRYSREDGCMDGWQRAPFESVLDSGYDIRMSVVDLDGVEVWQ